MAQLYRRGRVYWARVQRQGREFRRSLKTTDRAIAQKRIRQWVDDLDATRWGDRPRRTFDEAAERFIREHLTTLSLGGARRYGVSLKNLAVHFGSMLLDKIAAADLNTFENKRRGQGVTSSTIRRDLACLSSMITSAIDWGWLDEGQNPVPAYLRRRAKRGLKEGNARTRYMPEDEEAALLEAATSACGEAMAFAIDTGLRSSEQFSLQWPQIDLERGVIRTTTKTKSGRARYVPLPERSRTIVGTLPRRLDSPYVFVNPDTGTRYVNMVKGLKAAARRAGIVDLRWHDLRRTAGCRWLQRDGKSMEEVSILLGHSGVNVTQTRYAFLEGAEVAASLGGRTKTGTGTADITAKIKAAS